MARHDIGYDFEDFGHDQVWLEEKYGAAGHPEYTIVRWRGLIKSSTIENEFNGYWDWVMCNIEQDDDDIPGSDE